jgi:hypothetical protein
MIYSVTVAIQRDAETEWLDWMTRVHVPEVVQTGCFTGSRIFRVVGNEAEDPTYVLQYHCESMAEYERYQQNFAPALQKDHTDRFAGRFRASRQLLEEIAPPQ